MQSDELAVTPQDSSEQNPTITSATPYMDDFWGGENYQGFYIVTFTSQDGSLTSSNVFLETSQPSDTMHLFYNVGPLGSSLETSGDLGVQGDFDKTGPDGGGTSYSCVIAGSRETS